MSGRADPRNLQGEPLVPPPDDSVTGTPPRRPQSVRRTAHINMVWPDGFGTATQLRGRARDLLTGPEGTPRVLAEAGMVVSVGPGRTIESVEVFPGAPGIEGIIGAQGGGRFRSAIDAALPGEREAATPLYFLLDDIAGATLIAGFAWSQANPSWMAPMAPPDGQPARQAMAPMRTRNGRIICSGLRPGGYHQIERQSGSPLPHFLRPAGELSSPEDPWAWHEIEPAPEVCMRRRRRVDAWRDGSAIEVEAHFRDSMWDTAHRETAVHEYSLRARVAAGTHVLIEIEAVPRVLPFPECPWAAAHVTGLVGLPVDGFRTSVQDTLTELHCCTHLNDMLRCLAEVPVLVGYLDSLSV